MILGHGCESPVEKYQADGLGILLKGLRPKSHQLRFVSHVRIGQD